MRNEYTHKLFLLMCTSSADNIRMLLQRSFVFPCMDVVYYHPERRWTIQDAVNYTIRVHLYALFLCVHIGTQSDMFTISPVRQHVIECWARPWPAHSNRYTDRLFCFLWPSSILISRNNYCLITHLVECWKEYNLLACCPEAFIPFSHFFPTCMIPT